MYSNVIIFMIKGIGIDISELDRFRRIRFLGRVAELYLTDMEYQEFSVHLDQIAYAASRFALKEAVIKAVPVPIGYKDIEIQKRGLRPHAKLLDVRTKGMRITVSLSHSTAYAAGFAVVS